MAAERRVLHLLPHPGGGGETYARLLEAMPGYRSDRLFLSPSPRPGLRVARSVAAAFRAASAYDLVHVEGEGAGALCLPLLASRPSVVTLNGLHLVRRLRGAGRSAATVNLRLIVRAATRTICVSQAEREHLAAAVGPRDAARAVVVPNGVELPPAAGTEQRAAVRVELGLDPEEPVGIWVGSLDAHKDPLTAVQAAVRASVTLLVVGDGPLRGRAEAAAGGHARVLGRRTDVPRLLAAADFFVLSSSREGLSFALLEAMAAGLPAIVSDLPENREAAGEAGIAVRFGDVDGFAAAFQTLKRDGERSRRGELARRRVAERFQAGEMIGRTRAVYEEALAERQPRTRPLPTAQ